MKTTQKATLFNTQYNTRKNGMVLFYKMVCVYLLGGIVGTVWETVLNLCRGNGFVYCNGSIFTPFNFVYGFGAVVIVLCLQGQSEVWKVYLMGTFGGGAVEYLLSFLEEKLLGTRSWNYEGRLLNINGRTTLVYMAFWGLLCVSVIFLIYKPLSKWLDTLPQKEMIIFGIVVTVILALDLFVTVSAIFRYAERNAGKEGVLWIAQVLDRFFDDEYMMKHFPNMRFKETQYILSDACAVDMLMPPEIKKQSRMYHIKRIK